MEDCCQFKTVIPLPVCDLNFECVCGPYFDHQLEMGLNCVQLNGTPLFTFDFSLAGEFGDCDRVIWNWVDEQLGSYSQGADVVTHTFPGPGEYTVCIKVIRTLANGKQCEGKFCKDVRVLPVGIITSFPNPASSSLNIQLEESFFEGVTTLELIDANNRIIRKIERIISNKNVTTLDVQDIKTGVYILRINMAGVIITKRVLVVH